MRDRRFRWLPLTWQVGGTLLTTVGYILNTLDIAEVAGHIALLSLLTAIYLSVVVRDRRPEDFAAILGYLAYGVGLGFVSAPSLFALDAHLTTPTRALGGLFLGLILVLTWIVYAGYVPDNKHP